MAIRSTSACSFWFPERTSVGSGWAEHGPFAFWLIDALRPQTIVELGTHKGYSFAAFCQAVKKLNLNARCFAVDTWRGDEHAGLYNDDVYDDLQSYVDARYAGFARMIRSTFDEALAQFEDGSIDLLHIDGRHYFEDVTHDFETWIPKLKPNAVVLFHDTNVHERDFGVHRLWKTLAVKYPHFEFLHGHGLGVLGIGSDFPSRVAELFAIGANEVEAEEVRAVYSRLGSSVADHFKAELADAAETKISELQQRLQEANLQLGRAHQQLCEAHIRDEMAREREVRATTTIGELEGRIRGAESYISLIHGSMTWRSANLVTSVARRVPGLTVTLRQTSLLALKLNDVRRHRPVARTAGFIVRKSRSILGGLACLLPLGLRKSVVGPDRPPVDIPAPAVQPEDRFSLSHIPALNGDFSAATDWHDFINPEVSIVILNWNRSAMTLLCLQHLWERTSGHRYEIIVVDNGSSAADIEFLQQNARLVRIIPLGRNCYFGEANNIGAEAARGKYVCFLNNDAFVHQSWLSPLVDILESDSTIGAVGPRFLYPGGNLQEAGALINKDGNVTQLGKGRDDQAHLYFEQRTVDYVSAACVLLRRSDFQKVLGFDLTWEPAYYEDVDLCLKLKLEGLSTVYCPLSVVTHIENATSADTSNGLNLSTIVDINRIKFVARWGQFIESAGAERPVLIPEPSRLAPLDAMLPDVLIFTPYNLTPGGGERFILTIAEAFRGSANVTLVTRTRLSRVRILTMGRELGLDLDHLDKITLAEFHARTTSKPAQLAFVLGNEIFPPIGRMALRNVFICQFPFPVADENHLKATLPNWKQFDLIVTYSAFVSKHVRTLAEMLDLQPVPLEVLYPPVPMHNAGRKNPAQILHVGRFFTGGHCKRQDVLIEAFRSVLSECPDAELHLVGSIHPEAEHRDYYAKLVVSAHGLPVHFHPNCSPEKLQTLYAESAIYWHATGFGEDVEAEPQKTEHFGISVIEAMSAGCVPMVPRAGGPAEVVQDGVTGFYFDSIEGLASRTQLLVQGPRETLDSFSQAATKAAAAYSDVCFRSKVRSMAKRFFDLRDR